MSLAANHTISFVALTSLNFRVWGVRMEVQRHVQCNLYIYMYHMYSGSRIKRLEKVRFPFRRYAAYGPSVIASNFAD